MRAGLHSSGRLWRRARQAFKPHPRNALRCYAAPSAEANVTSSQLVNKSSYTMSAEASPSPSTDARPALAAEVETLRKQLAQLEVWCPFTPCICSTQQSRSCTVAWKAQACVAVRGSVTSSPVPLLPWMQGTLKQKEAELKLVYPYSRSYGKSSIATVLSPADGGRSLVRVLPLGTLLHSRI